MTTEQKRTEGGLYPEMLHQIISNFDENKTEYTMFVESGTNSGETLEKLYNEFETLHTIELDQKYYEKFDKIIEEKNYEKNYQSLRRYYRYFTFDSTKMY